MAAADGPESTTTREPPPPTAPPPEHQAGAAGRTAGRATVSMILGILSIPFSIIPLLAWLCGVAAIVLGVTARGEIRRTGIGGNGRAMAGIICGVIGVVLGLGVFLANLSAAT
jgi:Domain of unknown function (DUF4190)